MPNLGQQLANGGAILYNPLPQNQTALTTAHASEYVNRARDLVRRSTVAALSNARLGQVVNQRDILNQNQLLANRQARLAELAEAQGRYFNQFGSVLNDKALSFLDQMSNISAPTFTAILAGYEHARASHADMEQARLKEYERMMNLEHALQTERVALRKREMENEISVAQAMNEQMMADNQNYWKINKELVQMYGGKVNVPQEQAPSIIGGGGYRGRGVASSGGETGTVSREKQEIQDSLAKFAKPSEKKDETSAAEKSSQTTTTKSPDTRAEEGVKILPGLDDSYATWLRDGWNNDSPAADAAAFRSAREFDAGKRKISDIFAENANITDPSKYTEDMQKLRRNVAAVNAWIQDEGKTGFAAQVGLGPDDLIKDDTADNVYAGLYNVNRKMSDFKRAKADEAARAAGGTLRKGASEVPAEGETGATWPQRMGEAVGSVVSALNPLGVQEAQAAEAATSTANPTGQPTSEDTGLAEVRKINEEAQKAVEAPADFLQSYMGEGAPLRYQIDEQAQALRDINALYRSGKLDDKTRQAEVTELLEAGERPSDVLESLKQGTTSRYNSELRVRGDLSKYRTREDFSKTEGLERFYTKKNLGYNDDGTMSTSTRLSEETQQKYPGIGSDLTHKFGSNRFDDSGSEEILQRYRKTDADIEDRIVPYLKTRKELDEFYRLSRGTGVGTPNNPQDQRRLIEADIEPVAKLLEQGVPVERILASLEARGAVQDTYKPIVDEKGNFIQYTNNKEPKAVSIEEAKKPQVETKATTKVESEGETKTESATGTATGTTVAETPADEYREDQTIVFQEDNSPTEDELRAQAEQRRAERAETYAIETAAMKNELGTPQDAIMPPAETETTVYGRPRNQVYLGDPQTVRALEADDRRRWFTNSDRALKAEQDRLVEEVYRRFYATMASSDDGVVDFESIPGPATQSGAGATGILIPGQGSVSDGGGQIRLNAPPPDFNVPMSKNIVAGSNAYWNGMHSYMKEQLNVFADNMFNEFGIKPAFVNMHRNKAHQARLHRRYLQGGPLAASAGNSYHQAGLAADIDWRGIMAQMRKKGLSRLYGGTEAGFHKWLDAQLAKAGLHRRLQARDWPHVEPIRNQAYYARVNHDLVRRMKGNWDVGGAPFELGGSDSKKKITGEFLGTTTASSLGQFWGAPEGNQARAIAYGKAKGREIKGWGTGPGRAQPFNFTSLPRFNQLVNRTARENGVDPQASAAFLNMVMNITAMGETSLGTHQIGIRDKKDKGTFGIRDITFNEVKGKSKYYGRGLDPNLQRKFATARDVYDLTTEEQALLVLTAVSGFKGPYRRIMQRGAQAIASGNRDAIRSALLDYITTLHWAGGSISGSIANVNRAIRGGAKWYGPSGEYFFNKRLVPMYLKRIDDYLNYISRRG